MQRDCVAGAGQGPRSKIQTSGEKNPSPLELQDENAPDGEEGETSGKHVPSHQKAVVADECVEWNPGSREFPAGAGSAVSGENATTVSPDEYAPPARAHQRMRGCSAPENRQGAAGGPVSVFARGQIYIPALQTGRPPLSCVLQND